MISVCMATYNGEKFLSKQIESILPQLDMGDELLISDDGSSDETLTILSLYANDSRVKVIKNTGKNDYSTNFQNALEQSKGDYIFLSDQDDIWCSSKVSVCLSYLKDCDFVIHDARVVSDKKETLHDSYFKFRNTKKGFINNFYRIGYLGCCMAFRRSVYLKASPFPLRENYITHDSWLCLVSEFYFKTRLIDKALILYRRHSGNASNGGLDEGNSIFTKIHIRLVSLYQLFRIFKR